MQFNLYVHRNSVLTNNAYYCIDSKAKTFQMEKKYSFTGAVVPCPHDMEIFKPMKLSLSHFEAKDKSTPAPKFGYVHRTPAQNKKDCIFREVAVPELYHENDEMQRRIKEPQPQLPPQNPAKNCHHLLQIMKTTSNLSSKRIQFHVCASN